MWYHLHVEPKMTQDELMYKTEIDPPTEKQT